MRDASGQWIAVSQADSEILVLSPEGKKLRSIVPEMQTGGINTVAVSEDGRVYACFNDGIAEKAAEIFPDSGEIGPFEESGNTIYPGSDGYAYWSVEGEEIWGRRPLEDGGEKETLLNFTNSVITRAGVSPVGISKEAVFFFSIPAGESAWDGGILTAYLPAEDIDLRTVRVLKLAYFRSLPYAVTKGVNSFNGSHPDARIVTEDWSLYPNYNAGQEKLIRDMVTGIGSPDIVVGADTDRHMTDLFAAGLYTDLTPYLAADDTVNGDNLFGCVRRLFDDGRGGMWGIAPNFMIGTTVVSTPDLLGGFAEQGYWTVSEVLDYAESLPEDCVLMQDLTQSGLPLLDGAGGYMIFVDAEAGTCSFDSPEFIRWLNFAKGLPTFQEYSLRLHERGRTGEAPHGRKDPRGRDGGEDRSAEADPDLLHEGLGADRLALSGQAGGSGNAGHLVLRSRGLLGLQIPGSGLGSHPPVLHLRRGTGGPPRSENLL